MSNGFTPNWSLEHIPESVDNGHTVANEALDAFELAISESVTVDLSSGDEVLSDSDYIGGFAFSCVGHSTSRNLTLPQIKKYVLIINSGGGILTVIRGSSTVQIPASGSATIYTDGTSNGMYALHSEESVVPSEEEPAERVTIMLFLSGKPANTDDVLFRFRYDQTVTYLEDFEGSYADAIEAPADDVLIRISKNDDAIGSISFPQGATEGIFSLGSDTLFEDGDFLKAELITDVDSTFSSVSFTLSAIKGVVSGSS